MKDYEMTSAITKPTLAVDNVFGGVTYKLIPSLLPFGMDIEGVRLVSKLREHMILGFEYNCDTKIMDMVVEANEPQ